MMLSSLLLTAVVAADKAAPTKIIEASLYKNGYAVVLREFELDKDGETIIEDVPRPTVGTLWFTTSGSAKLEQVLATNQSIQVEGAEVGDLLGLLSLNEGKAMTIELQDNSKLTGTLIKVVGETVRFKLADGSTMVIRHSELKRIHFKGEYVTKTKGGVNMRRVLKLKHHGTGKGYIYGIEPGLSWQAAYLADITDPKTLKLTAKATLINDLAPLTGLNVKLVTGFPNLPYLGEIDPLVADFMMVSAGRPGGPGGGGFGGGGFGMNQQSNRADSRASFDEAFSPNQLQGNQEGELFLYELQNITMSPGDRAYNTLFTLQSPYEHVYTWDISDSMQDERTYIGMPEGPGDVWHSLKFKNTGNRPFTTAVATASSNDQIVGQDTLYYTSPGAEALLRINKAMDVRAEGIEEELGRERVQLEKYYNQYYDLVNIKGTLEISNRKNSEIKLRINKVVTGDVTDQSDNPKIAKTTRGLRSVNPITKLQWEITMKPGETKKVTYTYKVYIRS